jgi:hypothetical protein
MTSLVPSTLGDGRVETIAITITSSLPPFTVVASTVAQVQTDDGGGPAGGGARPSVALVLGSLVGGTLLVALLGALIWLLRKRARRNPWADVLTEKDVFSPDPRRPRAALDVPARPGGAIRLLSDEPKPYQYGVVGHAAPSLFADDASPLHSPGLVGTPLPSPGLVGTPLPSPGLLGTPQLGSHSPAPSDAALLPRVGSPPTPPAVAAIPVLTPERRRSTSVSLSIGTPQPSQLLPARPLTLANWDPRTDGVLADGDLAREA